MCVWINSSHCCMADILLNVRKAKYLFSTIFVGTNSDCDVIYALCPKAMITWNFFLMYFDNEINTTIYSKYSQTCLSELRSTRIPVIRNKLLGTDFSQRISSRAGLRARGNCPVTPVMKYICFKLNTRMKNCD